MTVRGLLFDLDETLHSREAAFWKWIDLEARARPLDRQKVAELDARGRGPNAPDYLHTVLKRLQPRLRLGIVSNGSGEAQRSKLKTLGIEQYFDPILISEETGSRKPQPEIFCIAAERWQIPNNQILVVGDDDVADIQGAIGAGMLALRVGASGAGSAPSISSISELEGWLDDNALLGYELNHRPNSAKCNSPHDRPLSDPSASSESYIPRVKH
jgi:HAD superfamily hydrolase (TIGR01549 family)